MQTREACENGCKHSRRYTNRENKMLPIEVQEILSFIALGILPVVGFLWTEIRDVRNRASVVERQMVTQEELRNVEHRITTNLKGLLQAVDDKLQFLISMEGMRRKGDE